MHYSEVHEDIRVTISEVCSRILGQEDKDLLSTYCSYVLNGRYKGFVEHNSTPGQLEQLDALFDTLRPQLFYFDISHAHPRFIESTTGDDLVHSIAPEMSLLLEAGYTIDRAIVRKALCDACSSGAKMLGDDIVTIESSGKGNSYLQLDQRLPFLKWGINRLGLFSEHDKSQIRDTLSSQNILLENGVDSLVDTIEEKITTLARKYLPN